MADFKQLIQLITQAIDRFNNKIPGIQSQMLDEVLLLSKKLEINGGSVRINAANLKLISDIKGKLQKIILNPDYIKSVKEYVSNFNELTNLQNQYFNEIADKFSPPGLTKEILKQAKESVVSQLTETGLDANITDSVKEILRKGITSGIGYAGLQKQLTDYLTENDTGEGQLQKYVKQISTDSINQFSRTYSNLVSNDLGLEWFRYSGSNIETTRPFCLACTKRKFIHVSELTKIIHGDFEEFREFDGKINSKTHLPQGMYPETDESNFATLLGGYNCGHQWRPVSEDLVPEEIKRRVYASLDFKEWADANGKDIPELPEENNPTPTPQPPVNPDAIDLTAHPEIKNITDAEKILLLNKDKLAAWFNNTEFKTLVINDKPGRNGLTPNARSDKNGMISMSSTVAKSFIEAMNNIRNNVESTLIQESAMATMWHEIWHNINHDKKGSFLTETDVRFMELGNEFAARKTLNQFFEKFGGTLKNTSLQNDRTSTGYNRMVRNYDHLIEFFKADQKTVLDYVTDKMRTGDYEEVKEYLVEALQKGTNIAASRSDINNGVMEAIRLSEVDFKNLFKLTR